ncbi:hypothetical protein KSS87_009926 [Heliosperma pusillum]|nr:hypothetical protein KSS87_009926 [Heliosperma pusillum]
MSTPQPHGLTVPDASMHPVRSSEDVIQLMKTGLKNSVVTIHVHGKDLKSGATTHGSLHLVDLAGSERVDRSEATGDRLKEAQHINKSLSSLGDVIFALAQKTPHVPYRNSKLTQVLQTSLGGRAKTLMFVQLNPDVNSYSETLSSLKFAERVSGVELGASRNNKEGRDVKELMEQVASLKDSVSTKNEEIERSLKDPRSPCMSSMHSLKTASSSPNKNALKSGVSSPLARSITSSPREVLPFSGTRRTGIVHKSFDSFSDHSDPCFQVAFEDSESEGIRPSRSMNDLKGQKKQPGGTSMDDVMKAMADGDGDGDNTDRLSETSDSNFSVGTDQSDATTESNFSQEQSTTTDSPEKRGEKPKTSKRHPQSVRAPTRASRMSQVKTTSTEPSAPKRPGRGSSSEFTSSSGRRWM